MCIIRTVMTDFLRPHGLTFSPPGSSVHGILQTRILEWVAILLSGTSSQPRDQTWISCIGRESLVSELNSQAISGDVYKSDGLVFYRWRRQCHPTPVLLPGKSHGWRSLVGCSPWGHKELDMTEQLHFHFSLSCLGEGNGNPLQCSCLENPRDGGAWWAAVYGVAQSQTRLKRLSSSSSSSFLQKRWGSSY